MGGYTTYVSMSASSSIIWGINIFSFGMFAISFTILLAIANPIDFLLSYEFFQPTDSCYTNINVLEIWGILLIYVGPTLH